MTLGFSFVNQFCWLRSWVLDALARDAQRGRAHTGGYGQPALGVTGRPRVRL